jgi:hypothetical protein
MHAELEAWPLEWLQRPRPGPPGAHRRLGRPDRRQLRHGHRRSPAPALPPRRRRHILRLLRDVPTRVRKRGGATTPQAQRCPPGLSITKPRATARPSCSSTPLSATCRSGTAVRIYSLGQLGRIDGPHLMPRDRVGVILPCSAERVRNATTQVAAPVAEIHPHVLDVRDTAAVEAFADEIRDSYGGVDTVFSNTVFSNAAARLTHRGPNARDRRQTDLPNGTLIPAVCPGLWNTGASRPCF